eukprot:TRINITY_DN29255_c0_g1_i1.p1 TRINITY_DN29255_c0_g1~~TRINITY_DN29255_c0_g1_i1.p1  ORF type:complete len:969 (+),score=195.40 TRINITY_DN29255_c0_g1_i1:84-2990(+)
MPHPVPVDGWLNGCTAHVATAPALLPNGRFGTLAGAVEEALDLYLVFPRAWRSGAILEVTLPSSFVTPGDCAARPLTPWLAPRDVSCRGAGAAAQAGSVEVHFAPPLPSGAAVGVRLTPFRIPSNYEDVHPGVYVWPTTHDTIAPKSLNVRLRVRQPSLPAVPGDACHPPVWACGLRRTGWPDDLEIRPSRLRFSAADVIVDSRALGPATALVEFVLPETLTFDGSLREELVLMPPYGYVVRGLQSSNLFTLQHVVSSGQLNMKRPTQLDEVARERSGAFIVNGSVEDGGAGVALRVQRLVGTLQKNQRYYLSVAIELPSDAAAEPSVLEPTRFASKRSGCANAWGLALQSAEGERLVSAFMWANPLAFVSLFEVRCSTPSLATSVAAAAAAAIAAAATQASGTGAGTAQRLPVNWLTLRFLTTERVAASSQPEGTQLILSFTLPAHFALADPVVAADFVAPFQHDGEADPPIFGSARPQAPAFVKLGCPRLLAHARGRRLRIPLSECAVAPRRAEDSYDMLLVVDGLPPGAELQLMVPVRNPVRAPEAAAAEFALSVFRTTRGLGFWQVPAPAEGDQRGSLLRVQAPLRTPGCSPLFPPMKGEVYASRCLIDGRPSEATVGFTSPVVLPAPVMARLEVPAGYRFPWFCRFNATDLLVPGDRTFEYIPATDLADCEVAPDGRSATFRIKRTVAKVLTFFTVAIINPSIEEAPAVREHEAWSIVVGGHAAGGLLGPRLQIFSDLSLEELPYVYNDTSWALKLRLRPTTAVPAGGHVVLRAPQPFLFPAAQCRGEDDSTYGEVIGSPQFVPAMGKQPFRPIQEVGSDALRLPAGPDRTLCFVDGEGGLVVSVLEGALQPGLFELRFAVVLDVASPAASTLLNVGRPEELAQGPLAPMRWALESWSPSGLSTSCTGDCCPERRANFRPVVGAAEVELLDRGLLEAYPEGRFRHRRIVHDGYGGWRVTGEES